MMRTAREILERYWDQTLPVDPLTLAKHCGAKVIEDNALEDGVSGSFFYEKDIDEKSLPVIRYNPREHPLRQRFTIAHELGHYALGHQEGYRDDARTFFGIQHNARERQANHFAAELLMPADVVYLLIDRLKNPSITSLAQAFRVSERALDFRLKNLGIV